MEDHDIIKLYLDRNESAISETASKYGKYCRTIAMNILHDNRDAEECVNDTYLNTWNSIPPQKPCVLSVFLGRITRNLSFNKYKYNHADKRGSGEISLILDELDEIVSGNESVEDEVMKREMVNEINTFLQSISLQKRSIFILRYWYSESISNIAERFSLTENAVSVTLNRIRKKLREHLTERSFIL